MEFKHDGSAGCRARAAFDCEKFIFEIELCLVVIFYQENDLSRMINEWK